MSFVFSKNKEKRSRLSTGESNNSFVKNVTSRVTGFLPAGITKWFSSPSSSSGNGSAAIADGTDSSTEDEAPESPGMLQPPAKRARFLSPLGKYSHLTTSQITTTSNDINDTGSILYNSIQSPIGRNTCKRENNCVSTPIRDFNEETMHMNSSMERNDREYPYMQHSVSAIGQSVAMKRKSLFDSPKQREQSLIACAQTAAHQVKDINQPCFKPHLLGSPFYPGQTMYGGASATPTYINHPNIKQRKMTYINESKDDETVNMSLSSRRVMDLLENYSSPLIEAKRIPRYEMSEIRDINNSIQPSMSSTRNSYKTQELYLPSNATLVRMKARRRLLESTTAARQIMASHSSTLPACQSYNLDAAMIDKPGMECGPTKSQSKMKSTTKVSRGMDPFEMPEKVDLPAAVLQIDKNNMPKFSLGGPNSDPVQKPADKPSNEAFKFSTPLPVTSNTKSCGSRAPTFDFDSPEKAKENTSPPKFSFGNQNNDEETKTIAVTSPTEKIEKPAEKKSVKTFSKASNDWKCSDCWVSNKASAAKCACCGAKQPKPGGAPSEVTSKCTTCKLANTQQNSDKCANCEKMRANLTPMNPLPVTKTNSSKWKCGDCWVDNEESADKCVCCGSRHTRQSAPAPPTVSHGKDWKCDDCLLPNSYTIERCGACGSDKPGSKPPLKKLPSIASKNNLTSETNRASNLFGSYNNKMLDIIATQKSAWECSVCLASNANDKPNCLCCDAERYPQKSDKPKFSNFKFNAEATSGFKFGIDPKIQETNLARKVETPKPMNIEESETNNNIIPDTPAFALTKMDKPDAPKTDEKPKPLFSFGFPKQNATPAATGFVPIAAPPATLPDIVKPAEDNDNQEVPSITFKAPVATKPSTDMFSPRAPTDNPQNAMNAFLNSSNFNNSAETKSLKPNNPPAKPSAAIDAPKPQFSFSAGAAKPSTGGMFAPSASTPISNSLSTQADPAPSAMLDVAGFPQPAAAATPAVSFFTKPEATAAPSTMPFQNNVQNTPAAPTLSTPLFSFGNSQSATPAPAAAPAPASKMNGFNFTFGSTTSTPAFGVAAQPMPTFGVPAANPMHNGPNNPLGGNGVAAQSIIGISGGNGIAPSGNGIMGASSAPLFNNAPAVEPTSMWPCTTDQPNQANPFMASAAPQETFMFGSTPAASPFGVQASAPAKEGFSFGATTAPSPFGASTNNAQPCIFGANTQPAQNIFGMSQNNANQTSMFGSPAASQPEPMFGSAQPVNPAPSVPMFGAPSASPFGASTAPMATFEAPSPAPAFNFGASQASTGVFGFGQQPQPQMQPQQMEQQQMQQQQMQQQQMQQQQMQQQQMQQQQQQHAMQQGGIQQGMYNFSGATSPAPVQFSMGTAPSSSIARRPVRKAVRRNQQR